MFIVGWIVTGAVVWACHAFFYAHASEVMLEVFVACSGELLFFSVVGLAVTLITIEKPEDPRNRPVADRIKILFGISEVPEFMIRYSESVLEGMARYAKNVRRRVSVIEYDPVLNAYKVHVDISYSVQNVMHDRSIDEKIPLAISPDKFDQFVKPEMGKVISMMVDSQQKITAYTPIDIVDGFATDIEFTIAPSSAVDVEFIYEIWMKCEEPMTIVARRLVECSRLSFINRIAGSPVVSIRGLGHDVTLLFNQETPPYESKGVAPGRTVHDFSFKSPVSPKQEATVTASPTIPETELPAPDEGRSR
jgi:hypothetical protein